MMVKKNSNICGQNCSKPLRIRKFRLDNSPVLILSRKIHPILFALGPKGANLLRCFPSEENNAMTMTRSFDLLAITAAFVFVGAVVFGMI
jgi:hypothetical protein